MLQYTRKIMIVITTLSRMVICERMNDCKMYDTATSRRNGAYVLKAKHTFDTKRADDHCRFILTAEAFGQHRRKTVIVSFLLHSGVLRYPNPSLILALLLYLLASVYRESVNIDLAILIQ